MTQQSATPLVVSYQGKPIFSDPSILLKFMGSDKLKNDKEVVLEAVKDYGFSLKYASSNNLCCLLIRRPKKTITATSHKILRS